MSPHVYVQCDLAEGETLSAYRRRVRPAAKRSSLLSRDALICAASIVTLWVIVGISLLHG